MALSGLRGCAKKDFSFPIVSFEAIMISCTIDTKEDLKKP